MAATTYLEVDWRNIIKRKALIAKIDDLLTSFDSSGIMVLHLVNSTAKKLVRHEASRNMMMLQKEVDSNKVYRQGTGESASRTDKYLGRMKIVVEEVTQMIAAGNQCTPRNIYYRLKEDKTKGKFTTEQIAQHVQELALSINVHPYTLGMAPEVGQSLVRVPRGVTLEIEEVTNIFEYSQDKKTGIHKLIVRGGNCTVIGPMIKSIKVKEKEKVRSVVVTEHKSVKRKFDRHSTHDGFGGILLVMTGGFPGASCREFLHLLSEIEVINQKPFLWQSDNDPHSLQMYTVMKYGSSHLAYASASMVCPKLTFGGLTMKKMEEFFRSWPARFVADKVKQQPNLSAVVREEILQDKIKYMEEKLRHVKTLISSQSDTGDKQRMKGLVRAKMLDLPGEDEALAQLNAFIAGEARTSLYRLDELEQHGVAFYIAAQVAAVLEEDFAHPNLFGDQSQTRVAWNAAMQPTQDVPAAVAENTEEPEPEWDMNLMG